MLTWFRPFCWAALSVSWLVYPLSAQDSITAAHAREHIGQFERVCGTVASTHFAFRSKGRPTFLNLGQPYPNEVFTVVIWDRDREKFGSPETIYRNKNICVTGTISVYRGMPEIIASSRDQITINRKN
jgi:hypothetical protein